MSVGVLPASDCVEVVFACTGQKLRHEVPEGPIGHGGSHHVPELLGLCRGEFARRKHNKGYKKDCSAVLLKKLVSSRLWFVVRSRSPRSWAQESRRSSNPLAEQSLQTKPSASVLKLQPRLGCAPSLLPGACPETGANKYKHRKQARKQIRTPKRGVRRGTPRCTAPRTHATQSQRRWLPEVFAAKLRIAEQTGMGGDREKRGRALQPDGNPDSTLTPSARAGITLTSPFADGKWQAKAMLLTAADYGRGRQLKATGYCLKDEIYYRAPYKA